ncbi:hypothetical protein N431DRAFT_239219 [Stipitochalara longipes BDJ]|nr:hypothetical protein N431DRAFT_239219 [Stipitochalara longipes BDJ]
MEFDDSYLPRFQELSRLPDTHTKICTRLFLDHRPMRDLELRAGAALKGLEKGKANLEAGLAYLRGEKQEPECIHCSEKNSGPFRHCVVMKGYFGGSCTNCRYNEEQTRCSLRDRSKKKTPPTPRRELRLRRCLKEDEFASSIPATFERLVQEASRMTHEERHRERQRLILRMEALTEADALAIGVANDQ